MCLFYQIQIRVLTATSNHWQDQDGSTVPNRTIRGNKTPLPLKLSPSMSSEHLLNLNKLIA